MVDSVGQTLACGRRRRSSVDGISALLRGATSVGSGLLRGLSTDCGTPVIEDVPEEVVYAWIHIRHHLPTVFPDR